MTRKAAVVEKPALEARVKASFSFPKHLCDFANICAKECQPPASLLYSLYFALSQESALALA
jgi:hypothetical protein